MSILQSIKRSKTPQQQKIDSRLYLGLLHQRRASVLTGLPDFRFVQAEADGKIAIDVGLSAEADAATVAAKLQALGATIVSSNPRYRIISARVGFDDLEQLAAMPAVLAVRQHIKGHTNRVDTSEGDKTHGADEARSYFGVSGAGAKICVLSDGVDSLATSQRTGDLPPNVEILPGQAGGGDEGTAMLEIVHDLAPDAELEFATADTSEAQFAQNILDLRSAGCDVIVDDFIYFDESPFEDGPLAQAVKMVTDGGALYFSSAGNQGSLDNGTSGTWEGDFHASTATPPAALADAGPLHDFGDGGQSIRITDGSFLTLIWAEHYDLAGGDASTDFDLYALNDALTTVEDASTNMQGASGGIPYEELGYIDTGNRIVVAKAADGQTSSVPMFHLNIYRGELDSALATTGETHGHNAAAAAFSVAATPAAASSHNATPPGPFPGLFTSANVTEIFSSDGPRRIILNPDGSEITPGNRTSTGGIVRQKPDITAADGVSTSAPGFKPFYGTSAAAPHAAAIAGLLVSAVPSITSDQVRAALLSSAIGIQAPGVDRDTGAGIVMAHAALAAAGAPPKAFLASAGSTPTQLVGDGDGDATIEPNEDWSLDLPLRNTGGADATAISATLTTSTPGIIIPNATSAYPDLSVNATGHNATPFVFAVTDGAACGGAIDFTLSVTYSGAVRPQTFTYRFPTGSAGTPIAKHYTGPAVTIPNGGAPVQATLPISGFATRAYSVAMSIDGTSCNTNPNSTTVGINEAAVGFLGISLLAPDGTSDLVINHAGGYGDNFCQTRLDDASSGPSIQSVTADQNPFTGSYRPNNPLAVFKGVNPNGNWKLQAKFDVNSDVTGSIRAYSVIVTPAVCDAPRLGAKVSGTKTVSGNFVEGGEVTYTVILTNTGGGKQPDIVGQDEFNDTLPAGLTLVSLSATSGTIHAEPGSRQVSWNGTLDPLGGSVTISITETINAGTLGTTIINQGTVFYDNNGGSDNNVGVLTDDPTMPSDADGTRFEVVAPGLLSLNPGSLDFGNVVVGTSAGPLSATIANSGGSDLDVTTIDAPVNPFVIDAGSTTCPPAPFRLAPATSCSIGYTFVPGAVGPASQAIAIASDGGDATLTLQGGGHLGAPTAPIVLGGSPQQTRIGTAFQVPLSVQVRDAANNALPGVEVAFGAPATGASAILSSPTATTDGNGIASITATANDEVGVYPVTAHVDGTSPDAIFNLTNTADAVIAISIDDGREYGQYAQVLDYIVTLTNGGSSVARHVSVTTALAPQLDATATTWTCLDAASGACTANGSGALNDDEVMVPAHGSVTYILSAPIRVDADGITVETSVTATSPDQAGPATASDTDTLVIFREGFEPPNSDGADGLPSEPLGITLDAPGALQLSVPAATTPAIDTVLEARGFDGSGFRIDRYTHDLTTWLRTLIFDVRGGEHATAWLTQDADTGLTFVIDVVDGRHVLDISNGQNVETLDLGHFAASYALRGIDGIDVR